jgi:plastocyanin
MCARRPLLAIVGTAAMMLSAGAAAEEQVINLPIRDGELPEDQRVVRVRQGDDITFRWATDKSLTIHLHGYDIVKKLSPGMSISMRFTARASGRFPIGIHDRGHGEERSLGYLEVHPR